jgi:hypothetical protein
VEPSEVKRLAMLSGTGNETVVQKRVIVAGIQSIKFCSGFAGADV